MCVDMQTHKTLRFLSITLLLSAFAIAVGGCNTDDSDEPTTANDENGSSGDDDETEEPVESSDSALKGCPQCRVCSGGVCTLKCCAAPAPRLPGGGGGGSGGLPGQTQKRGYLCTAQCQTNGALGGAQYINATSTVNCREATLSSKARVPRGQYPRHCSCSDTAGFRGTGALCENHTR